MHTERELDGLVAEEVMGWTRCNNKVQWNYVRGKSTRWPAADFLCGLPPGKDADNPMHQDWQEVPRFSTRNDYALEVIEKMRSLGYTVQIEGHYRHKPWFVGIIKLGEVMVGRPTQARSCESDTFARAVALCAVDAIRNAP